jgi:RNA polymerase sigma factor (sigma-70 family)
MQWLYGGSAADKGFRQQAAGTDEPRLVARTAAGDRRAFEALYRSYLPRLARFLYRMSASAPLLEEIIDDTMLVVWRKAASFDGSCRVSTWIFAIAYRTARKALRLADDPFDLDADALPCDSAWEPDSALDARQRHDAVATALDALPMAQRMVVTLTYFHDMGYEEIAGILECPVNTVKTRMFHARRRLRTLLADDAREAP